MGGATALLAAAPAWAQPVVALPHIALVEQGRPVEVMTEGGAATWDALLRELRALGHIGGETIAITRWSAGGQDDDGLASLAAAVVNSAPDIVVTEGIRAVSALRAATTTVPIIASGGLEQVVASLARPGGNVTGINGSFGGDIWEKIVALLHEADPTASRVAWLGPNASWQQAGGRLSLATAERLGLAMVPILVGPPTTEATIRSAFAAMPTQRIEALVISPAPDMGPFSSLVAELTLAAGLPAIAFQPEYARAGVLMAYGPDFPGVFRQLAGYVDRVLAGADPAEMPVEQPNSFNFVVNLRTAAALGLTLPPTIMTFATEVIE